MTGQSAILSLIGTDNCRPTETIFILLYHYEVPKNEVVEKLDGVLRYPGIVNQDKPDLREAL